MAKNPPKSGGMASQPKTTEPKQVMSTPSNEETSAQAAQTEQDTGNLGAQDMSKAEFAPNADITTAQPGQTTEAAAVAAPAAAAPQVINTTDDLIEAALPKVGVTAKTVLYTLQNYLQEMRPGRPVDAAVGATHQANLYRALQQTLNTLPDSDFDVVFPVVLGVFDREAKGAMQEAYVFRFLDVIKLSSDDRSSFQQVLNMLKVMADPKGRQVARKQINFAKGFGPAINDKGRERVLNFFNI